jgi:hypothetical protein
MGEKRHFGFPNEEAVAMYTRQEFVDGCSFNFWMGVGSGLAGGMLFLLALAWKLNIL